MIGKFADRIRRLLGLSQPAAKPAAADLDLELASASQDVILRCGPDGRAHYASPSALRLLGFAPEEMIGKRLQDFLHPDDLELVPGPAQNGLETGFTCRVVHKTGRNLWVEISERPANDPATGRTGGVILVMRDVTAQKDMHDQLERLSVTDALSGLANRRAFDDALAREWARTLRERTQMSLLLIDIDHFASFGELYGQRLAEDCVRGIGAAIGRAVRRPGDLAARFSEAKFAVILAATDPFGATDVAEKIIGNVADLQLPHLGTPLAGGVVTISAGAASALWRVGAKEMPQRLLAGAEQALETARQNGCNQAAVTLLEVTSARP